MGVDVLVVILDRSFVGALSALEILVAGLGHALQEPDIGITRCGLQHVAERTLGVLELAGLQRLDAFAVVRGRVAGRAAEVTAAASASARRAAGWGRREAGAA